MYFSLTLVKKKKRQMIAGHNKFYLEINEEKSTKVLYSTKTLQRNEGKIKIFSELKKTTRMS